jgi:hypothetical protein
MQRWRRRSIRLACFGFLLLLTGNSVNPLLASEATAAALPPTLVEDFAYPNANAVPPERLITLVAGDGHIALVDCPPGAPITDDLIRVDYVHGDLNPACFKVTGPSGYIKVLIPKIYNMEREATHALTATLKRVSDGLEYRKTVVADNDPNCNPAVQPCYVGLGEGLDPPGTNPDRADLLEIEARPMDGNVPALFPGQPSTTNIGRVNVGPAGRVGSRGCTATLVRASWALTAASCLAPDIAQLQSGQPLPGTTVGFSGQVPRKATQVVTRPDRDVALVRLDVPILDPAISARATATAPLGSGAPVQAVGLGRSATAWSDEAVHSVPATASDVTGATTVGLTATTGPVCKGDAGGPILTGSGQVAAVINNADQKGCVGVGDGTGAVVASRVDDLSTWIGDLAAIGTSYLVHSSNKCLDNEAWRTGIEGAQQLFDCWGSWNQKWSVMSDHTIRQPMTGLCLDIQNYRTDDHAPVQTYTCTGLSNQAWTVVGSTIRNPVSGRCLQPVSGSNPSRLEIFGCNGSAAQNWSARNVDGEIRHPWTKKCMDLSGPNYANGTPIWIWDCVGGANQKWLFAADGTIREPVHGKCLDLDLTAPGSENAKIHIYDCFNTPPNQNTNQRWSLNTDGTIRSRYNGRCVSIQNAANLPNATPVVANNCTAVFTQLWSPRDIDGEFRNRSTGKCLQIDPNVSLPAPLSTRVQTADCTGQANQKWLRSAINPSVIRNVKTGMCLDVGYGTLPVPDPTPTVIYTCHGGWQQNWNANAFDLNLVQPDSGRALTAGGPANGAGAIGLHWGSIEEQRWVFAEKDYYT